MTLIKTFFRKGYNFFRQLLVHYLPNHLINGIPSYAVRHYYYKNICGLKIGRGSSIHMRTFVDGQHIVIGENSVINRSCYLDGRGKLIIGDKVSISPHVHIITVSHNMNSTDFENIFTEVNIGNYAWIGSRVTILPGITIGEGAVVGAGSVVTKDVAPFTFVAGTPAVKIKDRSQDLRYNPSWFPAFD